MATAFDTTNVFNLAETAAENCINGDAWLGSTSNVAVVHTKIKTGEDIHALYYKHELPAIGIQAMGGPADGKNTIGEFLEYVRLGFDIWATGPDFDTADTAIKSIMARLRRRLRLQSFAAHADSTSLDGFLSDGDLDLESYDFEHFPNEAGGWLVHGVTFATLTLISEE